MARYSPATSHPLDYGKPVAAPWHEVIDGLLVLREEHPLTITHDSRPRRASPIAQ